MAQNAQREVTLLEQIASYAAGLGQAGKPGWDTVTLGSYSGSNPGTITFVLNGTTVATATITYDANGNPTSIVKT